MDPIAPTIRSWLIPIAVGVLAIVLSFWAGRSSVPKQVIDQTVERHEERNYEAEFSQLQTQLRELSRQVQEINQKKNVVATKKTVKAPDGTETTEERVEDRTETTTKTDTTVDRSTELLQELRLLKEKLTVNEKIVTHIETRTSTPAWLLGVGVGVSVPGVLGKPSYSLLPGTIPGAIVGEISAQRHLFMGIYAGGAANTRGEFQLRISKAF